MSFIDWNQFNPGIAAIGQIAKQGQDSALAGYQLGQTGAVYSALRGVNLGDPASVQNALSGLTSVGAIDQAKALTDLAYTRGLNQAKLPVAQKALAVADQGIPAPNAQQAPDPNASDNGAGMRQVMQQGADATSDLLNNYKDPVLRAAAADVYKQKFAQAGVPQQNINEVFGDLSDSGLQAHQKYLAAEASGTGGVDHPTGFAASQQLLNSDPTYKSAEGVLGGPYANPNVQLGLQIAGLHPPEAVDQAISMTAPARSAAATAAFAEPTAQASATGSATGQAQVGSPPVPGAQGVFDGAGHVVGWRLPDGTLRAVEQNAQASAQGGANITTAPSSGHVTLDANGNPTGVAPTAGYVPTEAARAATIGAATTSGPAAAAELQSDREAAANSQPSTVALRKVYDLLPSTNTGPGTQATNGWRSFVISQLPVLAPLIPGGLDAAKVQTANTDELKKYMVQIAGAAAAQYGSGTNEKLAVAASGNPNPDVSNLAARDVTRMSIALQRANNAKTALFDQTKQPQTDYPAWAANYARTTDPRAFMLDLLSPPERQKVLSTITTSADKRAFLRGKQAAEAAGDYAESDIPR